MQGGALQGESLGILLGWVKESLSRGRCSVTVAAEGCDCLLPVLLALKSGRGAKGLSPGQASRQTVNSYRAADDSKA